MKRALLICFVSPSVGIGHLTRLLALAKKLNEKKKIIPEFLIFGNLIHSDDLNYFKVYNFSFKEDFLKTVNNISNKKKFNFIIFDIYPECKIINLKKFLEKLRKRNFFLISVDCLIEFSSILHLIWIPSFHFDKSKISNPECIVRYGWDTFLIQKRCNNKKWSKGNKVLILTGGSDVANLAKSLPKKLDNKLDINSELHWIKGPLSNRNSMSITQRTRLKWTFYENLKQLDELITQSNYVITVFGVSFFEVLQYGIPTVVFPAFKNKNQQDLKALEKEDVASIAKNEDMAVEKLCELMRNSELAKKLSFNSLNKMSKNGAEKFSEEIFLLPRKFKII